MPADAGLVCRFGQEREKKMTEDGLKSVIVKVGLTALVLACVGGVRDEPSNNRNTTVQVVEKNLAVAFS